MVSRKDSKAAGGQRERWFYRQDSREGCRGNGWACESSAGESGDESRYRFRS